MKRLLLLILMATTFHACQNDDNSVVIVCDIPNTISLNASSNNSATISWQDDNIDAAYTVEYGLSGFSLGTGMQIDVSSNEVELVGLEPHTAYDLYVMANCSASNSSAFSAAFGFTTQANPVIPQFLSNLSDMNLYVGDLADLTINPNAFEYKLVTPLFTDYAHKLRILALPIGEAMEYNGDGFPNFPNGTVLAKTFYYNNNEQDLSQGRFIIETRVIIRENDAWSIGNYVWNEAQTDAVLDDTQHNIPITWINAQGEEMSTEYIVPNQSSCIECHSNAGQNAVIGPKLRNMNFDINGVNQLQHFIDEGYLVDAPDVSAITATPDWEDNSYTLEERSRAYFDINCAHCHSVGGMCELQSTLRLPLEIDFSETNIFERRNQIRTRMQTYVEGFSMPFIGTTMVHTEGFDLIEAFLDSLE